MNAELTHHLSTPKHSSPHSLTERLHHHPSIRAPVQAIPRSANSTFLLRGPHLPCSSGPQSQKNKKQNKKAALVCGVLLPLTERPLYSPLVSHAVIHPASRRIELRHTAGHSTPLPKTIQMAHHSQIPSRHSSSLPLQLYLLLPIPPAQTLLREALSTELPAMTEMSYL